MNKKLLIGLCILALLVLSGCNSERVSKDCLKKLGKDVCKESGFESNGLIIHPSFTNSAWAIKCVFWSRREGNDEKYFYFSPEEIESCTFEKGGKKDE